MSAAPPPIDVVRADDPTREILVGVVSDTHGRLLAEVLELFDGADLILHAGDVGRDDILAELAAVAPVLAVSGNVDGAPTRERPLERRIETPAGRIAMAHGHLDEAPSTRLDRLAARFADFAPAIVVYGHSHVPKLDLLAIPAADDPGVRVFNPGSAGPPRFRTAPTVGTIRWKPGEAPRFEHRSLVWPPGRG